MLETVRQRGHLKCGVSQGLPGFSYADDKGRWSGLDVDFCRAVAAAVLGDAAKLRFTPLSAQDRFTALQSGEVDIMSRNTTWTLRRDAGLGLDFAGIRTVAARVGKEWVSKCTTRRVTCDYNKYQQDNPHNTIRI